VHWPWTQSNSAGHGDAEEQAAGSHRCEVAHVLPSGQVSAPSEHPVWQTVVQTSPQVVVQTWLPPSGAQSMSVAQLPLPSPG
jgi:hypothetical protein